MACEEKDLPAETIVEELSLALHQPEPTAVDSNKLSLATLADYIGTTQMTVDHTGGYNIQATLGIDVNTRNFAAGVIYSRPIKQNLAMGQIQAMPGINIHLSYIL